ncbi:uncharacterized protein LOC126778118 [Nymphalis io]|uniref:uncharacterized protein LOC126778118 n=1 Tax=Inachis io TaxID=171585 RepID=UPI002167FE59|nr:uncharacterized protein LOC126778118 [Nymphalis io]XP_050357473.1 uncharacterized protein LOC126778118 [Nymphalis io]
MSLHSSPERMIKMADSTDVLEVIRKDPSSEMPSMTINASGLPAAQKNEDKEKDKVILCPCKAAIDAEREQKHAEELKKKLSEKEIEMEEKMQARLKNEVEHLKDRFEFILHNEQVRTSYMLREAHRERKEKISALQTQLECKNLAGLMYIMCSERRKSRLEKMKLTEEYTNYIQGLQNILAESQSLILRLSRGYKTAARVDYEWRGKMMKVIKHFQNFVNNFVGGTPEANQFLLDLPALLKIDAPIEDNPHEDPCEDEEVPIEEEIEPSKQWWEMMDDDNRPFLMFGDMADLNPPQRREVLKSIKAAKTAPKKWKNYVFNDMFLKSKCPHSDVIKNEYLKRMPTPGKWECTQTEQPFSYGSEISRRVTTASVDIRGNMGSILKLITSNGTPQTHKNTLLGARDSMEIASTTKLREKQRQTIDHGKVVLNIGNKIDSIFNEMYSEVGPDHEEVEEHEPVPRESKIEDEDVGDKSMSTLGSVHNDSLQIISHVPELDRKINYEKICPVKKCQKLQVDSFIRSLPSYMRASPFTHIEQTYDEYEACSPEQLEILKRRIEEKKKREKVEFDLTEVNPLLSWTPSLDGVAVQTSDISMSLPPCTCRVPSPSPASSTQHVFAMADLIPVKQKLNKIEAECFFDDNIEFNRFKVIGRDESRDNTYDKVKNCTRNRLQEIKTILKHHPSLYDIFQANIRC